MSEAALRQRCRNLRRTRLRSDRESLTIKLLIWQAFFGEEPKPSQRALSHELRVWPSYVCKVQKQATSVGWDARVQYGRRVTVDDLADARRFTAKLREQEPGLLAPAPQPRASDAPRVLSADEQIAEAWRTAREEQRKHPVTSRRRVTLSVPVCSKRQSSVVSLRATPNEITGRMCPRSRHNCLVLV